MLTIFSTPKPFRGHIDIIQRNAIRSWTLLHPDVEVILFGDEEGSAEVCREFSIRQEARVQRNQQGTKYLNYIFDRAQELARHDVLCYVNCDIMLLEDFRCTIQRVVRETERFLIAGRRRDVDICKPFDFSQPAWEQDLKQLALHTGKLRPHQWIDYFVFPRNFYRGKIPPFVIGRPGWDNWLLWYARSAGARVMDASDVVVAIHQNHDYAYHPQGEQGVWQGDEAKANYRLLQGGGCYATLENATHRLTEHGYRTNYRHWFVLFKRKALARVSRLWFWALDLTRPLRQILGLRQRKVAETATTGR